MKPSKIFFGFPLLIMLLIAASQTTFAQTLPVKIRSHLDKSYSGWKLSAGDPICNSRAVVAGDFNGDKKTDYAVMFHRGQNDNGGYVVAFTSQKTDYEPYQLENITANDLSRSFLAVGRKGTEHSNGQKLPFDAPAGGTCEASSYFWIYGNGAFKQVFTSD